MNTHINFSVKGHSAFATIAARHLQQTLSDISTTVGFCERLLVAATDDAGMKGSTEDQLVEVARILALIVRLLDHECSDVAQIADLGEAAELAS